MKMDDTNTAVNIEKTFFSDNDILLQRIKRGAKYYAGIVITLAVLLLTGWRFDVDFLRRPVPHLVAMSPAMAFTFISPGISFLLFVSKNRLRQNNADAFIFLKENRINR